MKPRNVQPPRVGSEPYTPENVLDRLSSPTTLEYYYSYQLRRESNVLARRLAQRADVLSVGCGWNPGRHLFPADRSRLVGVDANPEVKGWIEHCGSADEVIVGYAGQLELASESFDVVLYRLVLHHLAYRGPLRPYFEEAARLLRPGGSLVVVEPGLWHPVGLGLALANRVGFGPAVHGTPDDVPLSPRRLVRESIAVGLAPELHAVTYSWRRLSPPVQRLVQSLDRFGSRPRTARLGHTLLLIGRKGSNHDAEPRSAQTRPPQYLGLGARS